METYIENGLLSKILGIPVGACLEISPQEADSILASNLHTAAGGPAICEAIIKAEDFTMLGRRITVKY